MILLSQKDLRWSKIQLGTCKSETIGSAGCLITCIAMMLDTTPDWVNLMAVYYKGCLLNSKATAETLGMEYSAIRNRPVRYPCIAEVKVLKNQHFVVVDGNKQYDPWTGKVGNYKILSYRNISSKIKGDDINESIVRALYKMIKQIPIQEEVDKHLKAKTYAELFSGFFDAHHNKILKGAILTLEERLL